MACESAYEIYTSYIRTYMNRAPALGKQTGPVHMILSEDQSMYMQVHSSPFMK